MILDNILIIYENRFIIDIIILKYFFFFIGRRISYGKSTKKSVIWRQKSSFDLIWEAQDLIASQLLYELYIHFMYSLLRVFTIIDINYIIDVYANTRTQTMKW